MYIAYYINKYTTTYLYVNKTKTHILSKFLYITFNHIFYTIPHSPTPLILFILLIPTLIISLNLDKIA